MVTPMALAASPPMPAVSGIGDVIPDRRRLVGIPACDAVLRRFREARAWSDGRGKAATVGFPRTPDGRGLSRAGWKNGARGVSVSLYRDDTLDEAGLRALLEDIDAALEQ